MLQMTVPLYKMSSSSGKQSCNLICIKREFNLSDIFFVVVVSCLRLL